MRFAIEPVEYTVYVAAPLTGDPVVMAANVDRAIRWGEQLALAGFVPFVPHAHGVRYQAECSHDYEWWMRWCLAQVARQDAVFRAPGISSGADREVVRARALGKPVFHDTFEAQAWLKAQRKEAA